MNPSPEGRGWLAPASRVRGAKMLLFTPHPPLRGTLSLQERDLPQTLPNTVSAILCSYEKASHVDWRQLGGSGFR
jgi:hypothetical protein